MEEAEYDGVQGLGAGKWGDIGQNVQSFSFWMKKTWESNVQNGDYIVNSTVYLKYAEDVS